MDAVDEEVLVLVIAVLAHDGAELGQLAIQDARDRIPLVHHDLVQPVGEQRDVGRERQGRAHDVRSRVHRREVEDIRGRDQDLGQEGVHGDPEDQREAAEPDPLALHPGERRSRAGEQQGERAVPRVVGSRAHVPTLHARFDVRPPQRPQPLGDALPLGGRPGGQRVGVRRARAHDRLQAAQPAHAGGPRRRGHLRLVGP